MDPAAPRARERRGGPSTRRALRLPQLDATVATLDAGHQRRVLCSGDRHIDMEGPQHAPDSHGIGMLDAKIRSDAPRAAERDGCAESPQSMKNGMTPPATRSSGSVRRHDNLTPSERCRAPDRTSPRGTPRSTARFRRSDRPRPLAAHAVSRDPSTVSTPSHRPAGGGGWSGSGAMISRYASAPRAMSAFRVPRPGCWPPAVGGMPVSRAISSMPRSRSRVA